MTLSHLTSKIRFAEPTVQTLTHFSLPTSRLVGTDRLLLISVNSGLPSITRTCRIAYVVYPRMPRPQSVNRD